MVECVEQGRKPQIEAQEGTYAVKASSLRCAGTPDAWKVLIVEGGCGGESKGSTETPEPIDYSAPPNEIPIGSEGAP